MEKTLDTIWNLQLSAHVANLNKIIATKTAELAAANKRIKELDDMYLKLSQKYADLYEKRK